MAERGRVVGRLRLCRGCRQFVGWESPECRFCGGDLDALEAEHETRRQAVRDAEAALRAAVEASAAPDPIGISGEATRAGAAFDPPD